MRHEQIGQGELILQVEHQIENLRLYRNIQRRDRLIGDDQTGIKRQRARDPNALPLPAAERMWEALHEFGPQTHQLQQFFYAAPALFTALDPAGKQWLGDNIKDGHARIERGIRVLKDHLHLMAEGLQRLLGQPRSIDHLALGGLKKHFARGRL